eukprot:TRINITY_DN241_c0_g1_i1.p1 TRINITY_DN241_c0_g1~~TRINITY_DN241_c0_g1_i1.p1  ORF type:complete len:1181 (-),score=188.62 TRINITY_DN241_c0_g1_i1:99-3641(-)
MGGLMGAPAKPKAPESPSAPTGPVPIIIPVTAIGDYLVVKSLGSGAFGSVHLVKDKKGNEFALKQILCADQSAVDMAMREIETLKKLSHPAIVKFEKHSYHEYQGHKAVCIVMQYVNGTNLENFLQNNRQKLDTQMVMKWFLTLLDALAYVHANGITHRDLKPANLLIDQEGNIKIADFGISEIVSQSKAYFTKAAGTILYMAPEMLQQEGKYDSRVDVWSMGVILYEVVTGQTIREVMAVKLAKDSHLIENSVDNVAIQYLLAQMLKTKDTRPTTKQLLENDIIKGWRDLIEEKLDNAPRTIHYLLPFLSSLGPGSSILRLHAIKYLENWSKISAVHKAINKRGMDGLTASLTVPEDGLLDKINNSLVLSMMTALCNRVHVGYASARALYGSGALGKLMQLLRATDSSSTAESLAQLLCLIIRYPQLNYVMAREEALHDWIVASMHDGTASSMFSAAASIYVDLPYFPHENWALPVWLKALQNDRIVLNFVRLIQHRLAPHTLVTPNIQTDFQNIVRLMEQEKFDRDRAESYLRLIRSYDRPIAQAYLKGQCTYLVTGEVFVPQIFFHCKSCYQTERSKVCCLVCVYTCHKGHNLKYRPPNSAYCDCGPTARCQALGCQSEKSDCSLTASMEHVIASSDISTSLNTNIGLLTWQQEGYSEGRMLASTCLYQPYGFDLRSYSGSVRDATAFYYEVEIIECPKGILAVGFAPLHTDKSTPKLPGFNNLTWGWHSDDGKLFVCGRSGKGNVFGPTYSVGDVVGCGVTGSGKVFYTLNGLFVGCVPEASIEPGNKLYATIGRVSTSKTSVFVRVRIQPPFKFTKMYDDLPRDMLPASGSIQINSLALKLMFGGNKMEDSIIVKKYFNSNLPTDLVAHFAYVLQIYDANAADRVIADLGGPLRHANSRLVRRLQIFGSSSLSGTDINPGISPMASVNAYIPPQPQPQAQPQRQHIQSQYQPQYPPQSQQQQQQNPASSLEQQEMWMKFISSMGQTPESFMAVMAAMQSQQSSRQQSGLQTHSKVLGQSGSYSGFGNSGSQSPTSSTTRPVQSTNVYTSPPTPSSPNIAIHSTSNNTASLNNSNNSSPTVSSTNPPIISPAALFISVADKTAEQFELNISVRSISALHADFWATMSDLYPPTAYKIVKIEKMAGATGQTRIELKQDQSIARLKDEDQLIFHLAQI